MKAFFVTIALYLSIVTFGVFYIQIEKTNSPVQTSAVLAGSSIKVIFGESTGAGTHLGSGLILTANHVITPKAKPEVKEDDKKKKDQPAEKAPTIQIKDDQGRIVDAEVLWTAPAYDVALLKTQTLIAKSSNLSCAPLTTGMEVLARGNPMGEDFMTAYGRISAKSVSVKSIPWKDTWVASMAIAPGNSGGGVFNMADEVVGMAVGVMLVPAGFGSSIAGYTYIVPSTAICEMMGKRR